MRLSLVPARAASDPRLGAAACRVLLAIGAHVNRDGWCWPSFATIADMVGTGRQAVMRQVGELVDLGYLERQHRKRENGSAASNAYRIIFDDGEVVTSGDQGGHPTAPGWSPPEVTRVVTKEVTSIKNITIERNQGTKTAAVKREAARLFGQFKAAYPERGTYGNSYEAAHKLFVKLATSGEDAAAIIQAAGHYADHVRQESVPPRFIKSAMRFLEEGAWREYVEPPKAVSAPGRNYL